MDMTACAAGGFVMVDFKDFEYPSIKKYHLALNTMAIQCLLLILVGITAI